MFFSPSPDPSPDFGFFEPLHEYFAQQYRRHSAPLGLDPDASVRMCAQHFWETLMQCLMGSPFPISRISTYLDDYNELFQKLHANNYLTIQKVSRYCAELFKKITTLESEERLFYSWFVGRVGLPVLMKNNSLTDEQLQRIPRHFISEAQLVINHGQYRETPRKSKVSVVSRCDF